MKWTTITGVARPVILVVAASISMAACSATAAEVAGRGFVDTSYDIAERTRTQFAVAPGGNRIDTSLERAERIKGNFGTAAGSDTSYDAVEKIRSGR